MSQKSWKRFKCPGLVWHKFRVDQKSWIVFAISFSLWCARGVQFPKGISDFISGCSDMVFSLQDTTLICICGWHSELCSQTLILENVLEAMHFLNESCLFLNAEPSDCPKITTTIEEYHSEIVPQLGDRHFLQIVEHLPSFTFEKLFLKCSLYSQSSYWPVANYNVPF